MQETKWILGKCKIIRIITNIILSKIKRKTIRTRKKRGKYIEYFRIGLE